MRKWLLKELLKWHKESFLNKDYTKERSRIVARKDKCQWELRAL